MLPSLYINTEQDPDKLPVWTCVRGTNSIESYHSRAHSLLSGNNNSTSYAHMILIQASQGRKLRWSAEGLGRAEGRGCQLPSSQ